MGQRPHHQTPGIQAFRRVALAVEILRGVELRLDRGDDRLGDLVLHREHVGETAIVTLRPDVASGCDVVELRRDAHTVAVLTHAAFDYVTDSELLPDLLDVDGLALKSKRRVARDDEEPTQLGKGGDEVLADAVREILLLRIVAHVDEGQHCDGGTVGQRQRGPRPLVESIQRRSCCGRRRLVAFRRRADCANEAMAFARDGSDQLLVLAGVAERLPRGVNPTAQGCIRNNTALPDRGDEIVFADNALTILDEVDQHIEDLRLDIDRLAAAAQLAPVGIKCMIGK